MGKVRFPSFATLASMEFVAQLKGAEEKLLFYIGMIGANLVHQLLQAGTEGHFLPFAGPFEGWQESLQGTVPLALKVVPSFGG